MIVEAVWSAQIYSETCLHELGDKYYSSNRVAAVSVAKGERERERERKREREREREREKSRKELEGQYLTQVVYSTTCVFRGLLWKLQFFSLYL